MYRGFEHLELELSALLLLLRLSLRWEALSLSSGYSGISIWDQTEGKEGMRTTASTYRMGMKANQPMAITLQQY
jgi:hypothetical protein